MRAARRLAAEVLRASRYPGDAETVLLLVSELVTNAVRHAATDFELHVSVDRRQVTVAVIDHDRAHPPRLQDPGPHDTHGRGLQIVDRLATTWGTGPIGEDAKQVWFRCLAAGSVRDGAVPGLPARGVRAGPPSVHPPRR